MNLPDQLKLLGGAPDVYGIGLKSSGIVIVSLCHFTGLIRGRRLVSD